MSVTLRKPMTLAEFLTIPAVAEGSPEVVVGSGLERREVRWAHVFETRSIAERSDALNAMSEAIGLEERVA